MSETNYCARHPNTETHLKCAKCEELVCPRCMVHSPVGVRCPDCARLRRLPTFDVTRMHLARAIGAGLVLGVTGGVAVTFVSLFVPILLVVALAIAGAGYVIGEGISLAVNRRRGRVLKVVAALAMFIAFSIVTMVKPQFAYSLYGLLAGAAGFYMAINRF